VQSNLLPCPQFHELARRVQDSGITFIIEPHLRFEGAHDDQLQLQLHSGVRDAAPPLCSLNACRFASMYGLTCM
jgi:hypothetical protein